jgi:predicted alpha/beta hydrolase family esterase
MNRLPFPSVVVASTDDEYAHIERSRAFAAAWGSKLIEIGDAGHINADTGFGPWPEGERMLDEFCATLQP